MFLLYSSSDEPTASRQLAKPMISARLIICLLASLVSGIVSAGTAAEDILVKSAWVRSVPPVTPTSGGYFQLENRGVKERMLVAVSSTSAGNIEIHSHRQVDGMMRMRRIPHVHIPANGSAALAPGGMHLMIFRLKKPLLAGESIPLQLQFDDGSSKSLIAEIR